MLVFSYVSFIASAVADYSCISCFCCCLQLSINST